MAANWAVDLCEVQGEVDRSLTGYDRVVIGASIRYGFHRYAICRFMRSRKGELQARRCAFFSVNLVARKPAQASVETNPYMRHFLRQIGWFPVMMAVFAGKLDYPRYGCLDRLMIRLIMWITGGPTDPATVIDYTDWPSVDQFAAELMAGFPGKAELPAGE